MHLACPAGGRLEWVKYCASCAIGIETDSSEGVCHGDGAFWAERREFDGGSDAFRNVSSIYRPKAHARNKFRCGFGEQKYAFQAAGPGLL